MWIPRRPTSHCDFHAKARSPLGIDLFKAIKCGDRELCRFGADGEIELSSGVDAIMGPTCASRDVAYVIDPRGQVVEAVCRTPE
jgi:hypothetical protein